MSSHTAITTSKISVLLLTHKRGAGIALLKNEDVLVTRVTDKTAETLASLFQTVLEDSFLSVHDIVTLIVGIGPGSFTGLRLGCAFANGIKLGCPKINLLPISTAEIFDEKDESQNTVTLSDLHTIIHSVRDGIGASFVPSLQPEYGREPGPVLKLKKEGK